MLKTIKNRHASIMLVVVIISASLMTLFLTVAFLAKQYRNQVSSLEYGNLAENAAENAIEEAIVRYFENSEEAYEKIENGDLKKWRWRRRTVLYSAIINNTGKGKILTGYEKTIRINDKIKLNHEGIIGNLIGEVGSVKVNASRLKKEIITNIQAFGTYEYRLTAEEREINGNWSQEDIKKLNITWNKPNGDPIDAGLEVIQISWPIKTPGKIETHRIHFDNGGTIELGDISKDLEDNNDTHANLNLPSEGDLSNTYQNDFVTPSQAPDDVREYIYIFRAKANPILLKIKGLDGSGKNIKIPDRYVEFTSVAKIDNLGGNDSEKTYTKKLQVKKEIYTDFDSNFDYYRNFINF